MICLCELAWCEYFTIQQVINFKLYGVCISAKPVHNKKALVMLLYNGTLPSITIEPSIQCDIVIECHGILFSLS